MARDESSVDTYLSIEDVVVMHLNSPERWGQRYKTVVRGWYKPDHIILERPVLKHKLVHLRKDESCAIRFLAQGKAVGFTTKIIDFDTRSRTPYCLIGWPRKIEVVAFRRFQRVNIFTPCQVTVDDNASTGELHDISISGCRVAAKMKAAEGSVLELTFVLPDGLPMEKVRAMVRNVQPLAGGALYGCEFLEDQEHVQSDLAFFVSATLSRAGEERESAPRIMIVDDLDERAGILRRCFGEAGWRVFLFSSMVEALLRLRMLPPTVLMVSEAQKDAVGAEVFRQLKATRGFEQLPLFIHGGQHPRPPQGLSEFMAAGYFSETTVPDEIRGSVTDLLKVAAYPPPEFPPEEHD